MVVVDGDCDDTVANVLLGGDVKLGKVRVLQSFLTQNSLLWVELEALVQKIKGVLGGMREQIGQLRVVALLGQGVQHCDGEGGVDGFNIFVRRAPGHLEDTIQLVHRGASREEGSTRKELGQNTPNAPNIDSFCVTRGTKENLGGTVPTGSNVLSQHRAGGIRALQRSNGSSKTKVGNFKEALGVQKQVGGLQITMDDPAAMHVLQGLQELVDDVLFVNIFKDISANDSVKIRF